MGLKIGIFTDSYRPYTSGVVRSIETFSEELQAQGHEIFIFAPEYPKQNHDHMNENRVFRFSSIPAPTNHDFALAVPFSIRLRPTLKKIGLDIIHVHSPFLLGRLGARCAKKLNIPLVFTFHTLYDQYVHYVPIGQSITKEITKKFCADFCNHCNLVIVPTGIIGEHLQKWGVSTEIKALPTGINTCSFRTEEKDWLHRKFNIDVQEKILISVGRLAKEKNFSFILKSFSNVNAVFPKTKLVLVGNGPEKITLVNLARKLGISEKVIFTGTLTKDEMAKAYNSADIFVFASITETQGLVVGEAKASGLPTVAVKAFGISEMVENNVDGFLTDLDINNFVNKINLLLKDDDLRCTMSKNATINAEKISSQYCAQRLLEYYYTVIKKCADKSKIETPKLS
ncbi:glycosyltransferase family 4 protein [Desulfoscipio sp. XC116]|uniref:glycosyltransferase family 4 protein n=1 Tax=Desulfoscipio sp. XC116 TaxID=3144975 RepID=UPI00325BE4D5